MSRVYYLKFTIGDKVFGIYEDGTIKEKEVLRIIIEKSMIVFVTSENGSGFCNEMIGNTIFRTEDEARTALSKMREAVENIL